MSTQNGTVAAKYPLWVFETVPVGNITIDELLRAQHFYYFTAYELNNDFGVLQTITFYK